MAKLPKVGPLKLLQILKMVQEAKDAGEAFPLFYCLMFDGDVPKGPKLRIAGKLVRIVTESVGASFVPVVGELTLQRHIRMTLRLINDFNQACQQKVPAVVAKHEQELAAGTSKWDVDTQNGVDLAGELADEVQRLGGIAADAIGDAASSAKDALGDAADAAGDAAARGAGAVRDGVRRGINRFRGGFDGIG